MRFLCLGLCSVLERLPRDLAYGAPGPRELVLCIGPRKEVSRRDQFLLLLAQQVETHPSIHARQLPGGMSDPMLSAVPNSAGRARLVNVMVSLSRMDVCTALGGPMSIGHARRCHQYGRRS
jgi:hypothetical protein